MRSVLITGASTGIGRATALLLDRRGWRVFAGVRKETDAESLRGEGSERVTPLMLDVTEAGQIEAAAQRVAAEVGEAGLGGLVNNAGIAVHGESMAAYREVARRTGERGIPPERVAKAIEHALAARRPRIRYLVGLDAKAQARLKALLPTRVVDRLVARFTGG
jgi:NAD(P)-dependent dehydrogenase (short-subunit alcohol dehydrogenase family)